MSKLAKFPNQKQEFVEFMVSDTLRSVGMDGLLRKYLIDFQIK